MVGLMANFFIIFSYCFLFRQYTSHKDTLSPRIMTLKETPVQFGLSFEENEAESTTDIGYDHHADGVDILYA